MTATMDKKETAIYSGIAKQTGGIWCAMCDQIPITSHGETHTEALSKLLNSIQFFHGYFNGQHIESLPREDDVIEFTIPLALE